MKHAGDGSTTSTSGGSGLSGPQSRLRLVRAKPSPNIQNSFKKISTVMSRLGCRTICQPEDASFSRALLLCLDNDGRGFKLNCPKMSSHRGTGNLMDTFLTEG